jgi:hypothetical protein
MRNVFRVRRWKAFDDADETISSALNESPFASVQQLSRDFLKAQSSDGTPIYLVIRSERTNVTIFLLSCPEIDPSVHDLTLDTPLVHAARRCNVQIVQAIATLYGNSIAERLNDVNCARAKAVKFPAGVHHTVVGTIHVCFLVLPACVGFSNRLFYLFFWSPG